MQNMNALLLQTITTNAIKCEHVANLETILGKLKKNDLKAIVDAHGLKGCSSLTKPRLIERIVETISDVDRLTYIMHGLDEKMAEVLKKLIQNPISSLNDVEIQYIQPLYQLGYIYPLIENKAVAIVLPQEVKEAYLAIDQKAFEQSKARYELIYTYMRALVNLYGICEMEQLELVFNEYEPESVSFDEAMDVLFCKLSFNPYVQAYGPLLVCDSLLLFDDEDVLRLKLLQDDKSYYMPTKEEIMVFSSGECEMTPQLLKVKEYILKNICSEEETVIQIVREMGDAFTYQYEPKLAFMALDKREIEISSFELGQGLMLLLMEAYNFARTWENRGFRPAEIQPQASQWQQNEKIAPVVVPTLNPIKSTKVGRNEACPCGSQKKYKKCCGR